MKLKFRSTCLLLGLLAVARTAHGSAGVNVDFGTAYGTPAASYGAASGQAGSWNQVGLGVTALVDLAGDPSGVSLSLSALVATGASTAPTNNNQLLLNDNFFSTGGATWSLSLSNLTNGDYRVFLYAPSNPSVPSGDMNVGGVPVASIPGDLGGSLIEGTSWVSVTLAISDGTLAISGAGTTNSGLAGLQVVPVVPTALNVDFGTAYGTPAASYGAASGQAGSWNQVGLGVTALVDLAGDPSGVSLSLSALVATGASTAPTNNNQLLLNDNFFSTGGATWSLSLSNLTNGDYRVFLYAPSNPSVPSGDMNVGGVPVASIPGDLGGSLIEGTSWVSVTLAISDGTLAISGAGATNSGLAGLQVVPVVPTALNVDFGTAYGTPAASYGAASGQAGSWNQVGLGVTALVDLAGDPSGVSLSLSALVATGASTAPTNNNQLLLNDNFFSSGGATWSISLSNLTNGDYRVFLYAPSNPSVPSGNMSVGGVPVASIPGDLGGSLIEGTSWVSVTLAVSDGTLAISGAGATNSGLAGLQVVPVVPTALNVDFGTAYGTPAASYGAASGQAGSWNQVGLGVTALVDLAGDPSGVSLSLSALVATGASTAPTNNDQLLLNDNFFSSGGATWSISLSNLTNGDYRVFLYAPSNSAVPSGDMSVAGVPVASLPGDFGGSLIEGTSWVSVTLAVSDGTLAISGAGATFSGLAGLQVVPLPEPGSTALLGTGAAWLALLARLRRRPGVQPAAPGSTRRPVRRASASARRT